MCTARPPLGNKIRKYKGLVDRILKVSYVRQTTSGGQRETSGTSGAPVIVCLFWNIFVCVFSWMWMLPGWINGFLQTEGVWSSCVISFSQDQFYPQFLWIACRYLGHDRVRHPPIVPECMASLSCCHPVSPLSQCPTSAALPHEWFKVFSLSRWCSVRTCNVPMDVYFLNLLFTLASVAYFLLSPAWILLVGYAVVVDPGFFWAKFS